MFSLLRTKLIIFVGLPIVLVNIGLLLLSASQQQKAAMLQAEDVTRAITREHSIEVQSLLDVALGSAKQTASIFQNANGLENSLKIRQESVALILKGMLGKGEDFAGVFSVWEPKAFGNHGGRFNAYWQSQTQGGPILKTISNKQINEESGWYEAIRQNPQPNLVWDPVGGDSGKSNGVLHAIAPIINEGQFLGVVGVDIGVDVLEAMLATWQNPERGTVVHLHTESGDLVAESTDEEHGRCDLTGEKLSLQGVYWQGEKLVACQKITSSLAQSNLVLVMETPRQILLGPVQKQALRNALVVLGIVIGVLFFVGLFLKRTLVRLDQLGKFTRRVTLGQKTEGITDDSNDEIGQLSRDLTTMLASLQAADREQKQFVTRLEIILDSIQAGVMIIDTDERRITDANGAMLKMVGLTRDQVLNRHCHGFICQSDVTDCPVLKRGQRSDERQMELMRSDGSKLIVFKTAVPLVLRGRSCLLETFVDVDKQVKAEQELSEKLTQISHAKQQQDTLVNVSVSREERMVALKTEVNDLRSQLGMPERYKAPGQIEEWRQEIAGDKEWGT